MSCVCDYFFFLFVFCFFVFFVFLFFCFFVFFFFSSRRRHTRYIGDWSSDVCSSDLSNDRMEYTVIGDPVNLASRLAGIAKSDQIIILEEFFRQNNIEQRINAIPHKIIRVRGIKDEVSTWLVQGVKNTTHTNKDVENTL